MIKGKVEEKNEAVGKFLTMHELIEIWESNLQDVKERPDSDYNRAHYFVIDDVLSQLRRVRPLPIDVLLGVFNHVKGYMAIIESESRKDWGDLAHNIRSISDVFDGIEKKNDNLEEPKKYKTIKIDTSKFKDMKVHFSEINWETLKHIIDNDIDNLKKNRDEVVVVGIRPKPDGK